MQGKLSLFGGAAKIGDRFSRLVILSIFQVRRENRKKVDWTFNCQCDCGRVKTILAYSVTSGNTQSCGCLGIERRTAATVALCLKHGEARAGRPAPEYKAWLRLKARCENPKNNRYARYGGRGVRVCDRWNGSYENFLADMGRKPSAQHSIDRIDNDGNYDPRNCRWATRKEQASNTSQVRFFSYQGKMRPLSEVAKMVGIPKATIWNRIAKGWNFSRAVTTPVDFSKIRFAYRAL